MKRKRTLPCRDGDDVSVNEKRGGFGHPFIPPGVGNSRSRITRKRGEANHEGVISSFSDVKEIKVPRKNPEKGRATKPPLCPPPMNADGL
jgi:hypothetical protein